MAQAKAKKRTRASMLRNLRNRIDYYGKQGFVFVDFHPEELSTQKIRALVDRKGLKFLEALEPNKDGMTFAEYREAEIQKGERERLEAAAAKRIRAYGKAGFGLQDLTLSNLMKKDLKELQRIAAMSREEFLTEFGTTYTTPQGQTMTAAQALEIKRLEKRVNMIRRNIGETPLGPAYYMDPGRYIGALKRMASSDWYEQVKERNYQTYMRILERAASYNSMAKWLLGEIRKKDKEFIKQKIDDGMKQGFQFNLIALYDSDDTNLAIYIQRSVELFELDDYED